MIVAFGLACVLSALANRDVLENAMNASRARFLAGAGLLAAFLTLGYAAHYLRGGPRIIDATTYVLQAKALAHGHLSFPAPFPSASFRGRFLLFHPHAGGGGDLSGIFPPGWPLLLSLGYILGAPMLVGIALSAGLVIATYALAREVTGDEGTSRLAALLSIACGALRYHTADPMSHAASALGIIVALVCALRAARTGSIRTFIAAGAAIGYVACTRPVSAIPIFLVAAFVVRKSSRRDLAAFALAAVPFLLLLGVSQHFGSLQRAYYAVSDGPPDCFRYGFGKDIGCVHEHGDFVRARLSDGFGLAAAAGTTIRRLHTHLSDALDAWPVLFLALPAIFKHARKAWLLWALVALQVVFYIPFYFDGDYPGAGARFFADVLPIEHVAIAASIAAWLPKIPTLKKTTITVGLVAIVFALHSSYDHLALADRDGGKPMFEPERLQDAKVETGIVFIETDHGFNLARDPNMTDPKLGVVVARLRNDGHDRLLYDELGHPQSWVYRFGADAAVLPFTPPAAEVAGRETWRFEAEADWPPLAQDGAWAEPIWATGNRQNCPSNGQALDVRIRTGASGNGSVTISVPVPRKGSWTIRPTILARENDGPLDLRMGDLHWEAQAQHATHPTCVELGAQTAELDEGETPCRITVSGAPAALDRLELTPAR